MACRETKIVVIGAGSMCFGGSMIRDIFCRDDLRGSTLVLVDTNPQALEKMRRLAERLNALTDLRLKIEATAHRREALPGAQFVFCAVAVNRNVMWKYDLLIPRKHGVKQSLGENGGPGCVMHTIRSVKEVFRIVRDVEDLCPNAHFINFSNPESRIICALGRESTLKSPLGLCHGIFGSISYVAWLLGMRSEDIEAFGAGVNHFQWLLTLKDKRTGEDLYPALRQKVADWKFEHDHFVHELFRVHDLFPTCGGSHTAEHVQFGAEYEEHLTCFKNADAEGKRFWSSVDKAIDPRNPVSKWWTEPSGEKGIDVVVGMMRDSWTRIASGVVFNKDGLIENLPRNIAVEVPIDVGFDRLNAVHCGALPNTCAQRLAFSVSAQDLAVEAAIHVDCSTAAKEARSKQLVLQAVLGDPSMYLTKFNKHKHSIDAARAIIEEWWPLNRPYMMGSCKR